MPPCFWEEDSDAYAMWKELCEDAEIMYNKLTSAGAKAQEARTVLPQSTKADIVVTTYLDEWRHVFELRACDKTGPAHPQMKEVMVPLLGDMKSAFPFAFGDLEAK